MQKDFEDYEDYESPPFRWMSVVVLLLAVAGFFSLAWYAYYSGTSNVQYEEAVVIEADDAPLKVEPEDEGGMEFPHQEKTIYEAVESYNQDSAPVKVAAAPEKPIIPDDMPETTKPSNDEKVAAIIQKAVEHTQIEMGNEVEAVGGPDEEAAVAVKQAPKPEDVKTISKQEVVVRMEPVAKPKEIVVAQKPEPTPAPAAPQPLIETKQAPMSVSETKTKEPAAPVSLGTIPTESPKPKAAPKPVVEKKADGELTISNPVPMVDKKKPAPKAEPVAAPAQASTAHKLQLAAFRSNAEAESNWARISKAHSVLSGMPHDVQRADLGAKGVFYRLRVSGFSSKQDAINACAKLKAAKQGCFYTK
ncbi:MAG: SPOR domain-containing protein [Rickettsiales bacterium]|nr:SPOR domain-containing protein [Rickettsiales bacterium]